MNILVTDLRYAIRTLLQSPAFTILAIIAFALGIGANTAIFSVVNAVLLRPLPYPHPEQLAVLRESTPVFSSGSVSFLNYLDWRAQQHSFTDLSLFRRDSCNLSAEAGNGSPERVPSCRVTANFLSILGMKPRLGRDFVTTDDVPHGHKVALITESLWRRRFGGSASVIGQNVLIDGLPREIVGVLSSNVRFPRAAQVFLPLDDLRADESVLKRGNHQGFSVLGRLKPGVTMDQAKADLNVIALNLERQYPDSNTGRRVPIQLLLESSVGDYRQSLYFLLGAVGCVLLIACANVANLQLARMLARSKELAVRAALGASSWRLTRQVLTESALLSILGGLVGVLLAIWGLDAILALSPAKVPRFQETRIDFVALGFTLTVALLAGLLVGLWPAWRISKNKSLSIALHESARGSSGGLHKQRTRAALVVAQVALALILLAAGGLTLKSFWRAQHAPLGFEPGDILTMTLSLPKARYGNDDRVAGFYQQLLERIRPLPGVAAAAIVVNVPFGESEWDSSFHLTGTPPALPGKEPSVEVNIVSPDYFRVMHMPILRGRSFGAEETSGRPRSIIVDASFVERYLKGKDPIGQQVDDNQTDKPNPPPVTIVGVVPRVRSAAPGERNIEQLNFSQMYFCFAQLPQEDVSLVIKANAVDPLSLAAAVEREVQTLDSDQPVASIATMESNIADSLAGRRLTMSLLGFFAVLALVLASVGIYGVMAVSTTQRTRELGIRLALGATRGNVLRLVLRQGLALIMIGLVLGLLGALAAARALNSILYGVGALDLAALLGSILTLALVAFVACYLPARRATQVDPIEALRTG